MDNEEVKTNELTQEELNYVLQFAESIGGYSIYGNALTPMLLSQRMKDVTLNTSQATESQLTDALNSPKDSEIKLQEFSQDFEIQSSIYKKLLSYLGNMLSFDLTFESMNAKSSEYKTPKYNKDLDIVKTFIDTFDYRGEFTKVVQELLRNEAYFGCPRWDNDQITLQELPSSPNYTLINGRWSYGFLFSMNFLWFMNPGTDIDLYPKFFRQKFSELWEQSGFKTYNPKLSPMDRGDSKYIYWQDIPVDVGWCWKFNPVISTRVPLFCAIFPDLVQQSLMRSLQKNINMSAAARLVIGEIPLLTKSTQAGVKDQFSISARNLGEFLNIVKSAIGESLKTAAVPLTNIQGISFPAENAVYSSFLRNALASSGVNTNLIFTTDVRPNMFESQASLAVDEQMMISLYPQFEQFLNYHINKLTKQFKFKFHFQGTTFFNNRQQRFDKQTALAGLGIVLPQQIAASLGMNIFEFQRELEEGRESGFVEKLTPILSSFQQPANGGATGGGRPPKKDADLTDSGEETRSSGANAEKGGKI